MDPFYEEELEIMFKEQLIKAIEMDRMYNIIGHRLSFTSQMLRIMNEFHNPYGESFYDFIDKSVY